MIIWSSTLICMSKSKDQDHINNQNMVFQAVNFSRMLCDSHLNPHKHGQVSCVCDNSVAGGHLYLNHVTKIKQFQQIYIGKI